MRVQDVMSREVHDVEQSTSIDAAARMMSTYDVGALPVCDDGRVVGMVTDRDLVVRHLAEHARHNRVEEVMTAHVFTVEPDTTVEDAEDLMCRHQVRRLPVCQAGRVVGMITQGDIAREADPISVGEMVSAISARPAIAPAT